MKSPKIIFALSILAFTLLAGCETYHITTLSLVEQLANTRKEQKVNFIVAFPLFFPGVVTGNSLREIKVLDKTEKEIVIYVTNRTSVRITKKDGKYKTFYFDTLMLKDSMITGKKDHFLGINIKPININNVTKIELQR